MVTFSTAFRMFFHLIADHKSPLQLVIAKSSWLLRHRFVIRLIKNECTSPVSDAAYDERHRPKPTLG